MSPTARQPHRSPPSGAWLGRGAKLRFRMRFGSRPLGSTSRICPRAGLAATGCADDSSLQLCKCAEAGDDNHPIVMLGTWEPVQFGLISSFARPEGNVTGVAWFGLLPKRMEILKEIVPNLRRVAYVFGAP